MNMDEMLKLDNFWKKERRNQANTVVELQAPTIAEYFENLQKTNNTDKYKVMILELVEELNNSTDESKMRNILENYKNVIKSYQERIEKVKAGDDDIRLFYDENTDIDKTEEMIKPVEVICNFIDNLLYGGYQISEIQTYLRIWRDKAQYNILEPARVATSDNGRHAKNPYREIEEEEK